MKNSWNTEVMDFSRMASQGPVRNVLLIFGVVVVVVWCVYAASAFVCSNAKMGRISEFTLWLEVYLGKLFGSEWIH